LLVRSLGSKIADAMKKAILIDSSSYWASSLKTLLLEFDVELVSWFQKGTGWQDEVLRAEADYLFLEDQLPSRNGIKCLEKLHEAGNFSGKIIFMHSVVGRSSSPIEWAAWSRGASAILRKPFRRAEIKRLLLGH
jgi:FixJ family two-component response regulator